MAVALHTTTLTINPAFLQEIKDSNPDLWTSLEQLMQINEVADPPMALLRSLTIQLDQLRDQVALQFSLEECYGYMELPDRSSAAVTEQTSELAGRLRSQHSSLYLHLSDLAEQAEELQYRGLEVNQLHQLILQIREFCQRWQEHERLEKELIQHCGKLG